jgi:hypothetical protein
VQEKKTGRSAPRQRAAVTSRISWAFRWFIDTTGEAFTRQLVALHGGMLTLPGLPRTMVLAVQLPAGGS